MQDQEFFSRIPHKEIKYYAAAKEKRNAPSEEKRNKPNKKDYSEDRKRKRGE